MDEGERVSQTFIVLIIVAQTQMKGRTDDIVRSERYPHCPSLAGVALATTAFAPSI